MSGGSGSSGSGGASSGSSGGGGGSSGSSGAQPTTYASSPVADVRIYNGGAYGANWIDSSYGVRPFTDYSPAGHAGGVAKCNVLPYGATTSFFDKSAGDFTGRRALELFVYRGSPDAAMPDITIALAGPDTACAASVHFSSLLPSADATASGWVKFWVPLDSVFGGGSAGGGAFQGCPASDGSYLASGSVVKVDLRNDNSAYDALVCVDDVRLAA
ncbi:hypothetical protein HXX76_006307 [Chlamydomonas incerta]|uniref:Uncharacterized protein n=1 Tax=Chlamydomonas incerta TaxID=51695 RepID=A0A835W4B1_CHLIN|nr:hypothetical protein HXX76_006307 [Chlamydomonas incerta]|eukprot:KAG2436783.1 hypothetical protein HXX76_006307 [Chlamydomonas incerta]